MQRTIPFVNWASTSVGLELDYASGVDANSNPDEFGVSHCTVRVDNATGPVLHFTRVRVAREVGFAFEPEAAVPAVTADLERAAVAGAEARRVAVRIGLGINGFAVVTDDGEVVVVPVFTRSAWGADCAVGAGGPHDAQVLGLGEGEGGREGEGDAAEGRHLVDIGYCSLWTLVLMMRLF